MLISSYPAYANLVMGKLEEHFLNSIEHQPLLCTRFIDEIYSLSEHPEKQSCDTFKFNKNINSSWPRQVAQLTF